MGFEQNKQGITLLAIKKTNIRILPKTPMTRKLA